MALRRNRFIRPCSDKTGGPGGRPGLLPSRSAGQSSVSDASSWSSAQSRSSSRDHQRRRQPDGRAVGVLGQHAAVHQPLADLAAGALPCRCRRPAHRPRPRTSRTTSAGSPPSRSCRCAPSFARPLLVLPGAQHRDDLDGPTAQASGLPPKVEPCWPGLNTPRTSAVGDDGRHRHDAAAERLAEEVDVRARRPRARRRTWRPVRPRPDWISSAIISTPRSVQISRTAARNPLGGTITPASPWIGSTSTRDGVLVDGRAAAPRRRRRDDAEARA